MTAAKLDAAARELHRQHMADHGAPADGWDRLDERARAQYFRAARAAIRRKPRAA